MSGSLTGCGKSTGQSVQPGLQDDREKPENEAEQLRNGCGMREQGAVRTMLNKE